MCVSVCVNSSFCAIDLRMSRVSRCVLASGLNANGLNREIWRSIRMVYKKARMSQNKTGEKKGRNGRNSFNAEGRVTSFFEGACD